MGAVTGGSHQEPHEDLQEERCARMLLGRLAAAEDLRVARRVAAVGAVPAVREILCGVSPLPHVAELSVRLPAGLPSRTFTGPMSEVVGDDLRAAERIPARFVIPGDAEWPTQLDDLGPRAPWGLWVAGSGDLRLLALRSLSVVGARASTSYGEGLAHGLAGELAASSWAVISGGAFGIDAAAHRGALAVSGTSLCVLAGGVDVPYPRSHADLLAALGRHGALVSEAPLGGAPMRHRFLQRNRIIGALSRGTVVVEAALRSGSLTTARGAAKLNRQVMAFPGPVTSPMSAGCHELIRDGEALLVTSVEDVLRLVGAAELTSEKPMADGRAPADLSVRELRVLDAVPKRQPAALEGLVRTSGLTPTDVIIALGVLEARALVTRRRDGWVLGDHRAEAQAS